MRRTLLALALASAVGLVFACSDDDAVTGTPGTREIDLATVNGSGASGTAVITDDEGPNSTVSVTITGLDAAETYIGHVHSTTCAGEGGVVVALENLTVTGTTGTAESTDVPDAMLTSNHYIQYHIVVPGGAPQIACGDIPAQGGRRTLSIALADAGSAITVTGEAVISDTAGGTSIVAVRLFEGLSDGVVYPGHIHGPSGSCASQVGVIQTLSSVTGQADGTGSVVTRGAQDIYIGPGHYVQYHDPDQAGAAVTCGDIPTP